MFQCSLLKFGIISAICTCFIVTVVIVALNNCSCLQTEYSGKRNKIIIDNDAGGDDSMAIFLTLLYEKYFDGAQLIGLTTGNGNTAEENVYINNQKILRKANRQDVPIYRGSKKSLVTTPFTNAYYGYDGLGDNDEPLTGLIPAHSQTAVTALIELSKTYKGDLTVITIGTLTNIALAIRLDPEFLGRLSHLYVAAGHIHSNDDYDPEFNAHMDVEAYHIVTENSTSDKVTVLPFSQVKSSLNLTRSWREEVLGKIDTEIIKAQNIYERVALNRSDAWHALDPAAVATVLRPDLVEEYKYSQNGIIICGDKRGVNINSLVEQEKANVRVIYSVKQEEYKQFLIEVFSAELSHN